MWPSILVISDWDQEFVAELLTSSPYENLAQNLNSQTWLLTREDASPGELRARGKKDRLQSGKNDQSLTESPGHC